MGSVNLDLTAACPRLPTPGETVFDAEFSQRPGTNVALRPDHVDTAGYDAVLCQLEISDDAVVAAVEQATGLTCVNAAAARELPAAVMEHTDVLVVNQTEHEQL